MSLRAQDSSVNSVSSNGDGRHASPFTQVIAALQAKGFAPKSTGTGKAESCCPSHDGSRRNLSIAEGSDGTVLLKCHHAPECSPEAIVSALGMEMKDLFVPAIGIKPKRKNGKKKASFPSAEEALQWLAGKDGGKLSATWYYRDFEGTDYAAVGRIDSTKDGKTYRPAYRDLQSESWGISDPPRWLPYRADKIGDSSSVWFFEGEKCAELAAELELAATTTAHGAKSPHKTDLSGFAGKTVHLVPDNDDPGERYVEAVAALLSKLDPPPTIKIVRLPGLTEKGDDLAEWVKNRDRQNNDTIRFELLRLAVTATVWTPPPPVVEKVLPDVGRKLKKTRPSIEVNTERHRVLAETLDVLPSDPELYCRGGVLVRIARETQDVATIHGVKIRKAKGMVRVLTITEAGLSCSLPALADYFQWSHDKSGELVSRPVNPPVVVIRATLENGVYPGVRSLSGVAEIPFPRPDGTLVTTPGYDFATGVFLTPSVAIEPIPECPTQDDARAAAERLLALVDQFPFASKDDKAVWLAGLLTMVARPAIEGPVPGIVFNGNQAGTGKGKLIDTISGIAMGRPCPPSSYPKDEAEATKMKVAFALNATPIVHLDNLGEGRSYGSGPLDSALTSTTVNDRILGQSKSTEGLELCCVWFLSVNNGTPTKDAHRRWNVCNLVTNLERPEERGDLMIPDLEGHVREHRAELVRDTLVILRAHAVAGHPTNGWGPLGSFEKWDRIVRGAVWFATGLDCNATRRKAADDAPDRLDRLALLEAWKDLPGGNFGGRGITAIEAHRMACEVDGTDKKPTYPILVNALMQFSKDGGLPNSRVIGNQIRAMDSRTIGGLKFQKAGIHHQAALWVVSGESGSLRESDPNLYAEGLNKNSDVMMSESTGKANREGLGSDSLRLPDSPEIDWSANPPPERPAT